MRFTIYRILNKVNNKSYVGSTNRDVKLRWEEHTYPSNQKLLGKHIRLYGVDNFEFTILEVISSDELDVREKYWINYFNCLTPEGYNIWNGCFPDLFS